MRQLATFLMSTMLSVQLAIAAPIAKEAVPRDEGAPPQTKELVHQSKRMAGVSKVVEAQLKKLDPNIPIESIKASPMEGVYIVTLKGGHILYISADGKFLLRGDMLELKEDGLVNLTAEIRNNATAELLKTIDIKDLIVFSPTGETKGVVYAFTDVDCGYCRKLHNEVAAMNDLGIELRYLAFPRGGEGSPAYNKMTDAWCAKDRKQAITDLKTPKSIDVKVDDKQKQACKAIIDKQHQLGLQMGVSGTPAMVLSNGQMIPGYRPAAEIAKVMGIATNKPQIEGNIKQ